MASLQLYDQLLLFPLFQGMSRGDLDQVVGHTRFDFQKQSPQDLIIEEGSPCTHLYFLLAGTVTAVTRSEDHSYSLTEQLSAPFIFQPEVIFGYRQRYTRTFRAATSVSLVRLEKQEVVRLSEQFLVFRINLLNLFATAAQKQSAQLWHPYPATLEERIVRFIAQRCVQPSGPKTLHILMNQLALELGDSRLDISRALNRLQAAGLLSLHRGRIEIPSIESLL